MTVCVWFTSWRSSLLIFHASDTLTRYVDLFRFTRTNNISKAKLLQKMSFLQYKPLAVHSFACFDTNHYSYKVLWTLRMFANVMFELRWLWRINHLFILFSISLCRQIKAFSTHLNTFTACRPNWPMLSKKAARLKIVIVLLYKKASSHLPICICIVWCKKCEKKYKIKKMQ